MLTVSNLAVQFNGNFLFDEVNFGLREGDRVGLIGRNGTGKSTLLKLIACEITPESGAISRPNDYKVGYLPQEIDINTDKNLFDEAYTALKEITELEERIDFLTNEIGNRTDYESKEYDRYLHELSHCNDRLKLLGGHSAEAEIEIILTGLGFERTEFTKLVSQFSGGWQMRLELAKILLSKPDCVLLDEPTNHLDIDSIRWLEYFLKNYPGSIVIVSHDKSFLDNVTNRTIELIHGNIYDMNLPFSEFVVAREKQKEQMQNAYRNQQKQIAQTEKFIERFRFKATLASRVQSRVKQLDKVDRIELEEEDNSNMNLRFPPAPRSGRLVVETKKLSKSFGEKEVLANLDFALERGEKAAFVGKNGEGKTTFSKIIGKMEDYTGTLTLGSNVIIGYYAQHQASTLTGDLTVFELIDNAATGEMRTKVRSLLGAFLFSGDSVNKKVKVLSGGEKSRLALAKLLLEPCNLLILDEPTNHLDMRAKEVLKNALIAYEGAMIVVSHDRDFLQGLTTKTYEFKNKKIKEYIGDINYFLNSKNMEALNELEAKNIQKSSSGEAPGKAQLDRERRKQLQRDENKLKKSIAACEESIESYESQIAEIDLLFADPDFFADAQRATQKQIEYDTLSNSLSEKMNEWEDLQLKLEELSEE